MFILEIKAARSEFAPDSYVLIKYREGAAPSRLHCPWKGPLRIVSGFESKYILLDLINK